MTIRLSKSRFVAGCQCLKRLYWQVHEPKLAAEPDAAAEAIIEQGREVGLLARQLFPGGVEIPSDGRLDEAIRATRELIANPEVPAIFEGVFEHQSVLVRVDILQRRGRDGRWRLIEVKSSTDVRNHHIEDVGIQYRVVSRSGVDLASGFLAHVNRNYVYLGGDIDVWRFFKIRNLTRRILKLQPKLTSQLLSEFSVLIMPQPPDIAPGRQCADPVTCEFFDRCNPPRPNDHISYLPRIHASAVEQLEQMGIKSIRDIPDDFELSRIQRRATECVKSGEPWFESVGLNTELGALKYPLFFMDFESVNPCVPRFAGMHPYDHLCFQYSVDVVYEPGAPPRHFEFLATDASDPRRDFISSLCAGLGESGGIVVYNAAFESQRLSELASWLPEFADRINSIQARLFDLLLIVRNHVYHPAFAGSYSLKSVLPALVPEMTYDGMQITNGQDAGRAWKSLVREGLDQKEHETIKKALLDYCGQDTIALLRLLDSLKRGFTT